MAPFSQDLEPPGNPARFTSSIHHDALVHGISNPLIWRCPTPHLRSLYNRRVTSNHLVAVGTGRFLDQLLVSTTGRV